MFDISKIFTHEDGEFVTVKLIDWELVKQRILDLEEQAFMLQCLENGGVDNWEWYSDSLKPYYKKYDPDMIYDEEDEDD